MTQQAYIFDAIRTPRGRGKSHGSLHRVKPISLLSGLFTSLEKRHSFETSAVDDIVIGCVTPIGEQGANIAKTASLVANWDDNIAGVTLNRFCASGLEAINLAAMKIRSGWEQLVVAGGVESMSRVPMGSDGGAWAFDPETNISTGFMPQGIGADLIATIEGFQREEVDLFAQKSHHKAFQAIQRGAFNRSIIPVVDTNGFELLATDEMVRAECHTSSLSKLTPSFEKAGHLGFDSIAREKYHFIERINHVHTAANSSAIVDGASVVLVGNQTVAEQYGLRPRAKIISTALVGTDPTIMLTGPTPAAIKALKIANLSITDIDLFEVNEAFASVVLKFQKDLNIPDEKLNVNGGSIAMGHPLGATGAMLVSTLLDELEARDLKLGLVTLCVGGGMGIATIIERVTDFSQRA